MAYRDYYNILGVPRNASPADIKRAYRELARRWHPDRNPDDPSGGQRFKDATEAYNVLSDPEQRERYDRLGPLFTADGRPPEPGAVNDALSQAWRSVFGRRRPPRGDDLRYTLTLTLEEVGTGAAKAITLPRRVRCGTCGGDGAQPDGGRQHCDRCGGTGVAKGRLLRSSCWHCDGKGYTIETPCGTCSGEGRVGREDTLQVQVPRGVATGQKLRLSGKGNEPAGSGPTGDLFVVVNVAEHPLFRRRGEDLLVDIPLTFREVALGAEVDVPTLDGSTTIRVPAGTPAGRIFRLAGRGLPRVGRPGRGDLHAQVTLDIPTALSADQRRTLAAWSDALSADAHPRRAAYDAALAERSR